MKIKKPQEDTWSTKKIFQILALILVLTLALYGVNVGLRLYRVYNAVYEPLDEEENGGTDSEGPNDSEDNSGEDGEDSGNGNSGDDDNENADDEDDAENGSDGNDSEDSSSGDSSNNGQSTTESPEPVEAFPRDQDLSDSLGLVPIRGDNIWDYREIDRPFYESATTTKNPDHINILLLGYDENIDEPGRTDSIMIAHFNKETEEAALLSIPRDTYIKISGHGYDKAGHAAAYGGTSLAKNTIEDYLDIFIDYYIRVDMNGFINSIDALGGVQVYVQEKLVEEGGELLFEPGPQVMSGEDALAYTRARKLEEGTGGDYGRIHRQQQVIFEMLRKIRSGLSLEQTLSFMEQIAPYIRTDIGPRFILRYWRTFNHLDFQSMDLQTLPGKGFFHDDIYYLRIPVENARIITDSILD